MEAYDARKSDRNTKCKINQVAVQRTLQLNVQTDHLRAVVLDGAEANSSRELKRHGVLEHNIYIPNLNTHVCQTLEQQLPLAHVHNCSLHAFVEAKPTTEVHFVFADYCCTIDGNKSMRPEEDIKAIFATAGFLANRCVIGQSFNRRAYTKEEAVEAEWKIVRTLNQCALQAGYACHPLERLQYNNMVFLLHSCYKLQIASDIVRDMAPGSLFEATSKYERKYEVDHRGKIPHQPYTLPNYHKAVPKPSAMHKSLLGHAVMVCCQMTSDETGDVFTEWFSGRVLKRKYRNMYTVDYDKDGVEETRLSISKYSTKQRAGVGAWFRMMKP
jgi:hypothetical protein